MNLKPLVPLSRCVVTLSFELDGANERLSSQSNTFWYLVIWKAFFVNKGILSAINSINIKMNDFVKNDCLYLRIQAIVFYYRRIMFFGYYK